MSKEDILEELSEQIRKRIKFTHAGFNFNTKEDAASYGEKTGKLLVAKRIIKEVNWLEEED